MGFKRISRKRQANQKGWEIPESQATTENVFQARRRFVKAMSLGAIGGSVGAMGLHQVMQPRIMPTPTIEGFQNHREFQDAGRPLTPAEKVFRFNNFYEFSIDKRSPIRLCRDFKIDPWTLTIDGLVDKPLELDIDDIRGLNLEQRVYRFRCVEAWAMTVPWIGVSLSDLLTLASPKANARYVSVESFFDPSTATRQASSSWPWPYREAVTLREAMNPLAFAAIGMYGKTLQPQNGAPFRIVFPWKYGFKGAKSVVRLKLMSVRPPTFWNTLQPSEYGFFGNVNPDLPHPRWSQRREALLGEWGRRVATQKFNGYGRWVADLYPKDEY